MDIKEEFTEYASSGRSSNNELIKQAELFKNKTDLTTISNAIGKMIIILNNHRQIIYANKLFLEIVGITNIDPILGKRPGEAIYCKHALLSSSGCGTTEFCKTCGAVNAILDAQQGIPSTKECRITTKSNDALDLSVSTAPYVIENEQFTIFAISDISDEKRKQVLERVFFHDVMNSAGGISGLSDIMQQIQDPDELNELSRLIQSASNSLIEELQAQKQISSAERGDLELKITEVESLEILKELGSIYSKHEIIADKIIRINPESEDAIVGTDPALLRRVLGNMIKNAIEASLPKGTITLSCHKIDKNIRFSIHNSTVMPRDIQLQLFKRSFTTKGVGRGIGTYSMKLFGEKYLKGKVWFESTEETGTTFYLML